MKIELAARSAYEEALTVTELEATGLPLAIHKASTDAVKTFVAPWAAEHSSAPHMIYRHWADLARILTHGKGTSRESARLGNPDDYRALVYLEGIIVLRMTNWEKEARTIDSVKGYKTMRKIAEKDLKLALLAYRLRPKDCEAELLEHLK